MNARVLMIFLVMAYCHVEKCFGGLVFSVAPGASFVEGSGVQQVGIFTSGSPAAQAVNAAITVDFVNLSPGTGGAWNFLPGPNGAGSFGQSGWLGSGGALGTLSTTPGASSFTLAAGLGQLSLDFALGTSIPTTGAQIATINVNTSALGVGTYNIGIRTAEVDNTVQFGNVNTPTAIGSFSITAVPEPSSMVLMGLSVAGFGAYARFRKGKKKKAVAA